MNELPIPVTLGYVEVIEIASAHYENFPVASVLLPEVVRKHIAVIYWFARSADDLADEGEKTPTERQEELDHFLEKYKAALKGEAEDYKWRALVHTITSRNLTKGYFEDLVSAFRQDTVKTRYNNFEELIDYCRRSANPVGRLLLELFDIRNEEANLYSDKICTALQLINFYQDVSVDLQKGRIYLPLNVLRKYHLSENNFVLDEQKGFFGQMMEDLAGESERMILEGRGLLPFLPFRLRLEIAATINGGLEIIKKIRNIRYQVSTIRPVLKKSDYLSIGIKSFIHAIN
ncbi:MAG: squalene synthase HpnC [Ignavibacteriaceae bacterium]|nr:squalene synthase HpnC [Ignavibacteriaceae bacterium]